MTEKKTRSFFKRLVGFLHFLFACMTLVGIGFMYLNSNYGRGLDWIKTETFEQSPDFSKKVQADITNIFAVSYTHLDVYKRQLRTREFFLEGVESKAVMNALV